MKELQQSDIVNISQSITSRFQNLLSTRSQRAVNSSPSAASPSVTGLISPASLDQAERDRKRQVMYSRLSNELERVKIYDDFSLQDLARQHIPVERLHQEANERLTILKQNSSFQEELIKALLIWFKKEYFRWVDVPPCDKCGSEQTQPSNLPTQPTTEEIKYGAHRVEMSQCLVCKSLSRFPRYNDPVKLMQTRRGRCGEWANVFTLFCKSMGFEARYVLDLTDHVWTEVYIEPHCDACEAAFNTPLLYEVGWGKQLLYVFSFDTHEIVDTTRRYARKEQGYWKRLEIVDEEGVVMMIKSLNSKVQASLPSSAKEELLKRSRSEEADLTELFKNKMASVDETKARSSGSLEWRNMRGEMGATGSVSNTTETHNVDHKPYFITSMDMTLEHVHLNGSARLSQLDRPVQLDFSGSLPTLALTHAINDQRGSCFMKNLRLSISSNNELQILQNDRPITCSGGKQVWIEFVFRISNGRGGSSQGGADGMACVFQSDSITALGIGGCGLGYEGIRNSIAIELDVYQSSDSCCDPCGNHISVQTRKKDANSAHHRHSLNCTFPGTLPPMNDGRLYSVLVCMEQKSMRICLTDKVERISHHLKGLEYQQVLETSVDSWYDIFTRPTCEALDGKNVVAWIGFTAATGGLNAKHEILSLNIYSK